MSIHRSINQNTDPYLMQLINSDIALIDADSSFLGRGKSFAVRLHKPPEPHSAYAMKSVLPFGNFTKQEEQLRLGDAILEMRALSHDPIRQHPNIVELLGLCWETDAHDLSRKWPVLILEYAEGGTLQDFLDKHRDLTRGRRENFAMEVARGLQILHKCGIVHGDLKPANVLVCRSSHTGPWVAKLADFGGSVLDVEDKKYGRLEVGSFPWQAPEYAAWLTRDGLLRTDLYSLGLLYWSIVARGVTPVLDDPASFGLEHCSNAAFEDAVLQMKANEDGSFLRSLIRAGHKQVQGSFGEKADMAAVLSATVTPIPAERNLEGFLSLLEERSDCKNDGADEATTTVDSDDPVSPVPVITTAHLDHLYMVSDDTDALSPTIAAYTRARLEFTYHDTANSNRDRRSAAAFSLAVAALRSYDADNTEQCLRFLAHAAQYGNLTARSVLFRFCKTFRQDPYQYADHDQFRSYLIEATERGYPAAREDLKHILNSEERRQTLCRLRSRYAGVGSSPYSDIFSGQVVTAAWIDQLDKDIVAELKTHPVQPEIVDINSVLKVGSAEIQSRGDTTMHVTACLGLPASTSLWTTLLPVNTLSHHGVTPLLLACRSGHLAIAMQLLDDDADPTLAAQPSDFSGPYTKGETPLHWLCQLGDEEVRALCEQLAKRGADVNALTVSLTYKYAPICDFESGTPLHRAVGKGNFEAVQALLKNGAIPDLERPHDRRCPVYLAATYRYWKILEVLLCSLESERAASGRFRGQSLLVPAIQGTFVYGYRFDAVARHGTAWIESIEKTIEVLLKNGADEHLHGFPTGFDCAGTTPLFWATAVGPSEVLSYLIRKGCQTDINIETWYWLTGESQPRLSLAVQRSDREKFEILLASGADAHQPQQFNDKSLPLLWQCAYGGHSDLFFAREPLLRGAAVDETPTEGETAFALAVRNGCFALARFVFEKGADVLVEYTHGLNITISHGETVLGWLIREQTRSAAGCIEWLLREIPGIHFDVCSSLRRNALHACAIARHWTRDESADGGCELIARLLLEHFRPSTQQINKQDGNGYTALDIAVWMNNFVLVRLLVEAGADTKLVNLELDHSPVSISAFFLEEYERSPEGYASKDDPRAEHKQIRDQIRNRHFITRCFEQAQSWVALREEAS
ncbi:hypothetical protein LTR17_000083 [Elasticomyces elasticus]|nr:hypothetical protein LTR17_000083 [Elasticomyces elasticus]